MILRATALSLLLATASPVAPQPRPTDDALDGVDTVVLLTQGKEVFGKEAFKTTHGRLNYLFSTAETMAEFDKDPGKYAVQMGGLCARMAGTVIGNPSNYVVHDGKIYIFASDNCRALFIKAPAKYMPRPAAPLPTDTAAVARGRELLEKAAAAHGGAALDTATSYVETSTTIQQRPTGDVAITTKNMWQFPGLARSERTLPLAAGPLTVATLLTPAGGWGLSDGRSRPALAAMMPALELTLGRQLVPLLRQRQDPATRVAALPAATVAGVHVDRVRVVRGGLDLTLNIDPASSRVHSTSFVDRNEQGEVGEIVILYDNFRTVDGVTVPFIENALFNGGPNPALSRTLETAALNVKLDPKLFDPAGGIK